MIQNAGSSLTLRFEYVADTVPPPYHYEYTIRIGPGGAGEITFLPDYAQHNPPAWRETFAADAAPLDALRTLMGEAGVFSRRWRRAPRHTVGGSLEWLQAEDGERAARVPAGLPERAAAAVEPVYRAIRELVPQPVWDDLRARQRAYQQAHIND